LVKKTSKTEVNFNKPMERNPLDEREKTDPLLGQELPRRTEQAKTTS